MFKISFNPRVNNFSMAASRHLTFNAAWRRAVSLLCDLSVGVNIFHFNVQQVICFDSLGGGSRELGGVRAAASIVG